MECFYMQADKLVSADIIVSEPIVANIRENVQMPTCKYEILDENRGGNPVSFTVIGHKLYHKWTCEPDNGDYF